MLVMCSFLIGVLTTLEFAQELASYYSLLEPEPERIVHGEPWIRQQPDPDPDVARSRSGQTGSRPGYCRI